LFVGLQVMTALYNKREIEAIAEKKLQVSM
jgi:hypothetical protein